jgi:hypothetical protein
MMMRHEHLQDPRAVLFTCDEKCSASLRRELSHVVFLDVCEQSSLEGAAYCVSCAWCGDQLFIPSARANRLCRLHGNDCPDYLPQGTAQGAKVIRMLAESGMEITKDGWDEVAEELQVAAPRSIDCAEVIVRLCEHPGLVSRS